MPRAKGMLASKLGTISGTSKKSMGLGFRVMLCILLAIAGSQNFMK